MTHLTGHIVALLASDDLARRIVRNELVLPQLTSAAGATERID
jgi:hypothetical protein